MGIIEEKEVFIPPYTEEQLLSQRVTPKKSDKPAPIGRIDVGGETIIAVDAVGKYVGKYTGVPIPEGTFPVSVDTDSAFRIWDFKTETWGEIDSPLPDKVSKKLFVIKLRDEKIITQEEVIALLGSYKFPTIFVEVLSKIQSTKEQNDIELDLITENELEVSGVFVTALFKTLKYSKTQIKNFIKSIGNN